MGNPNNHLPFSASSATRWFNCPGSWQLEQAAQVNDAGSSGNDASRLGTAVHAMIEDRMQTCYPAHADGLLDTFVHIDPDGNASIRKPGVDSGEGCFISVTPEMVQDAQVCLDLVEKILDKHPGAYEAGTYFSELKTEIIKDTLGGTADIVIIDGDWACVIDYKNGVGHVDVEDNLQLQIYAIGVLENLKEAEHVERWTLCIVQPNGYSDPQKIRTWKTTTRDLNDLCYILYRAVSDCKSDNPPIIAGKWCEWCKANNCPAKNQALLKAADIELDDLPEVGKTPAAPVLPENLTADQLAWLLDNSSMVKKHIDNCLDEALARMQRGEDIPGYKLVESRTRRTITDAEGLELAAKKEGWDIWETKISTLKKLDKEVPKAELSKFVTKPKGKPTLAPESDKRPAIADLTAGIEEVV